MEVASGGEGWEEPGAERRPGGERNVGGRRQVR